MVWVTSDAEWIELQIKHYFKLHKNGSVKIKKKQINFSTFFLKTHVSNIKKLTSYSFFTPMIPVYPPTSKNDWALKL